MSRSMKRKGGNSDGQPTGKKQKFAVEGGSKNAAVATPSRAATRSTAMVMMRGDALPWKEVSLPDRLEDAEGFYGLEEIDDVEVVKDETNQHVMFRPKVNAVKADVASTVDQEWSGFADDNDKDGVIGENEADAGKITKAKKAKDKKANSNSKSKSELSKPSNTISDEVQGDLSFNILDDAVNEDSHTDVQQWKPLQLSGRMLSAIFRLGFSTPSLIQSSAIPPILEGHDVIGKAVTGSGKTLAFGIPILEKWLELQNTPSTTTTTTTTSSTPIALILAPTRELAHQLTKHLTELGAGLGPRPRVVPVTGGLSILKQQRQLEHADIVIGTPGRLWEVINDSQGVIGRLRDIQFLVVDEADRLLSEGHFKEVEDILDALDRQVVEEDETADSSGRPRQTLVFSATFHKGLQQKLVGKLKSGTNHNLLSNEQSMTYLLQKLSFRSEKPVFIDSNPTSQMAASLRETIVECAAMEKDLYLYALLLQNHSKQTLVFTNSISAVKRLTTILQGLALTAFGLHSGMPQKSRLRSLERFTSSRGILIATDVAARGLDIKGIDLIIHYHVPRTADMYVHRSGRTARADNPGRSILLCSPDEVVGVTRLIGKVHNKDEAPETVHIARDLVKRLAPRIQLAQRITEASSAREKLASKDEWLKNAAEELGVDYDSEEFEAVGQKGRRGRGGGKAQKQKQNGLVAKDQIAGWRAELKDLLGKKVNLGISERYLAGGRVDVDALLEGRGSEVFLEGR